MPTEAEKGLIKDQYPRATDFEEFVNAAFLDGRIKDVWFIEGGDSVSVAYIFEDRTGRITLLKDFASLVDFVQRHRSRKGLAGAVRGPFFIIPLILVFVFALVIWLIMTKTDPSPILQAVAAVVGPVVASIIGFYGGTRQT